MPHRPVAPTGIRGSSLRFHRRLKRNLGLGLAALLSGAAVGLSFERGGLREQLSAATAYVGFGCVAVSLLLGPRKVLLRQPNPVSSGLRRDVGIWGALVGLAHLGIGLTVHFHGRMQLYFLVPPEARGAIPLRLDAFGAANYLGVIAGAVLLFLLLLSNDRALRRLGARRWKAWQRLNYLGALAILGHGVLYQILERRQAKLVLLFTGVILLTVVGQGFGFRKARQGLTR